MNEVEEIKQRIDLVDLVGQYVQLKKSGANYKGVCPFHQEKTPSLMVSPQKQIWKCFGCGKGGSAFDFIMEAESLEFGDALKLLAQKAGVELKPRTTAEHQSQSKKELLYRINNLAARIFQKILFSTAEGKKAVKYLESRQITTDSIKKFGVGYASRNVSVQKLMVSKGVSAGDIARAGSPDKFFERIIFPIYDVLGNVIAFTGRAMGDSQPKYLNSPETPLYNKSRTIYGLNFAKSAIKQKDRVLLVEGQMDVISLSQAGHEEVVASSGTAVTETQLRILSKYTQNFLIGFDNDAAGNIATEKVIQLLLENELNGRVLSYGTLKDAGEILEKDPEEFSNIIEEAIEMVDWLIDQRISVVGDINFVENKKKVVSSLLPTLKNVSDATKLDYYLQRLSSRIGVSVESLRLALSRKSLVVTHSVDLLLKSNSQKQVASHLTNEEQLLAISLAYPEIAAKFGKQFSEIIWQSIDADRIATALQKWYTDKTLVKSTVQFSSQVKTDVNSQQSDKIDSWQFWLSAQWSNLTPALAEQLLEEKLSQLSTRRYEQSKTNLAQEIKRAQEAGDINLVKKLMEKLSKLTKEKD